MKMYYSVALVAVLSTLTACGGGGEGSSATPPVTIPTPTPTPAPSPTPTPVPSPTYEIVDNVNGQWFTTQSFAWIEKVMRRDGSQQILSLQSGIESGQGLIEAKFSGSTPISAHFFDYRREKAFEFSGSDISHQNSYGIFFQKRLSNGDYAHLLPSVAFNDTPGLAYHFQYMVPISTSLVYSSSATDPYEEAQVEYSYFAGNKTQKSDFPQNITNYVVTYSSNTADIRRSPNFFGLSNLTIDPATRSVSATFEIKQSSWENGTQPIEFKVRLSGKIDETSSLLTGTLESEDSIYSGRFQGYLYGPRGREIGLIFYLQRNDGYIISSGAITGASSSLIGSG